MFSDVVIVVIVVVVVIVKMYHLNQAHSLALLPSFVGFQHHAYAATTDESHSLKRMMRGRCRVVILFLYLTGETITLIT